MKRVIGFLLLLLILTSCSNADGETNGTDQSLQDTSWEDIKTKASETTVRLHMWGGDEGINRYIDEWVAPRMKEQYNIHLERTPMDTGNILQKLYSEKQANKQDGTIDVIWVNGENFKNAKENNLLYGPFRNQLPNFKDYYEQDSLAFDYDFGTPTEGYEAPWGKVQFVFLYDQDKIEQPPETFQELKTWIHNNPGEFTYPNPDDFSGNAFLRHLLYKGAEDTKTLVEEPFSKERASSAGDYMWSYLNEIKPDLWREGKHYPSSLAELDRLYSKGDVSMTMGYNEARAEHMIENNEFPDSTRSFVLDEGSIGNTHFLAIPYNSPNKAGAMTLINFLLSPEAQLQKLKPTNWGDNTPISIDKLSEEDQQAFESLNRGKSVLSNEILEESFLPEADAQYVEWIKENWKDEVIRGE
ncbi:MULTISPECIES: ABC transporter substrate-binding protein [Pontibacillus]|uniref:ABC transporter substrate-binding protein n=1 Tax=Pontibacillus chungwhensis TaxID=265426 RepID=A0ABY8UXE0_9BACI|nr:ABC transporter substrate-binding protein [Pontibacillus chungwhensis]MCD5325807.1 ABC transporter substrate-binding protein [Pontibacillus sp. HN14]WIF98340.1 ABC transporter substrate-binding protein [Pontibacillus chungwhensis]